MTLPAFAADDPLAKARLLYNQGMYEAAISAAEEARVVPARADAADLVAARSYLERFRETAASDDLTNGRDRLRRLNPQRFLPHERTEYIVGLGEALFFEGAYGAAANVFDSVLQSSDLAGDARDRVLDWWATAIDRDTRPRPEIDRLTVYQRVRGRLEDELSVHPASSTAAYWLAASARSQGDLQAAWDAAQAGWVRAPLSADHGAALRADLDRLMQRVIIPERAKVVAQPPDTLRAEWERFKSKWEK
jgi:tetratricopeptide (TPR) repeat protein